MNNEAMPCRIPHPLGEEFVAGAQGGCSVACTSPSAESTAALFGIDVTEADLQMTVPRP